MSLRSGAAPRARATFQACATLPAAPGLGRLAKRAAAWRKPRFAGRDWIVLIGSTGAVSSYSGTSRDAAQVLAHPSWRAQDGASFFPPTEAPR